MGYIPTPGSDGIRRYGSNCYFKGIVEDLARCCSLVSDSRGWYSHQCSRKRGHGPDGQFCKQHAKREPGGSLL